MFPQTLLLITSITFLYQGKFKSQGTKVAFKHQGRGQAGQWRGLTEVLINHSLQLRQGERTGGDNELQTEGLPDEDLENITESDLLISRK